MSKELSIIEDPLDRELVESRYLARLGLPSYSPIFNIVLIGVLLAITIFSRPARAALPGILAFSPLLAFYVWWDIIPRTFPRKRSLRILRECIREFGVPICNDCGYDLRNSNTSTCPECGTEDRAIPNREE